MPQASAGEGDQVMEVRAPGDREPLAWYAVAEVGEGQHFDTGRGAGGCREGDRRDRPDGILSVFDHH
ncbi:hypothetical protein GCM10023083_17540 [Streptomyces phyllanthi]